MISIDAHNNDLPRAAEPTTPKTETPNDTLEAAAAHTIERAMAHIIEASGDDEAATDATSVFLISAPVLETKPDDEVPVKVKEVQIKLETKLPENEGADPAADPAVLWHEAAILRPAQAPDADIDQLTTAMPVSIEPSQEEAETLAALEVPVPDADADEDAEPATRWVVQEKTTADAQPSEQTVIWEADAAEGAATKDAAEAGAGFVDTLQPGDRIAVLSRAEHPGWINQVERVEVTVVYEEQPAAEE
ncbi:hypothetical protein MKEN_00960000 [Mycena kentingensis (nom. inval.)]|nr:hypothetical protein MKEN_00960000 [Mycena kentingensis (nom. inval.)]